MPVTLPRPRRTSRPASPAQGQRSTGALAAAGAAAIAALVLGVLALQATSSPKPGSAAKTSEVLVAGRAIQRGTPLTPLAGTPALRTESLPASRVRDGALDSPDAVRGKLATADLAAGDQLTAGAVGPDAGPVASRLADGQRGITIPLDAAHGMAGDVRTGDRVDLYGSYQVVEKDDARNRPVVRLLAPDVRVLSAPAAPKEGARAANDQSQLTVSVTPDQAAKVAFTADNGKVWVTARPAGRAGSSPPDLVTLEGLLFDVAPVFTVEGRKQAVR